MRSGAPLLEIIDYYYIACYYQGRLARFITFAL